MRKKPTYAEDALWQRLRKQGVSGCKFRRQHPVDRFVVDFYAAQARLVIEVDGSVHDLTPEEDALRQELIEALGLRVLRFSNDEVLQHIGAVVRRIEEALRTSGSPPPAPPHCNGEG
jgi:very-short-patch-repair endonuclease